MKIVKVPHRVSLFGGGSDLKSFFKKSNGLVLGFSINKYLYIIKNEQISAPFRYRLSYSKVELANDPDGIQHPFFKTFFQYHKIKSSDIVLLSEVQPHSGLASSSALAVGMILLETADNDTAYDPMKIAKEAIFFERELLKEAGGLQDQLHVSSAGLNAFEFFKSGQIEKTSISADFETLNRSMFIIKTSGKRYSHRMQNEIFDNLSTEKEQTLQSMVVIAREGLEIFQNESDGKMLSSIGQLLEDSWNLKSKLSPLVSNGEVDEIISACRNAGALGAKLCGAGHSGYIFVLTDGTFKVEMKLRELFSGNITNIHVNLDEPRVIVS